MAILEALDLVVTIDTGLGHLAGAMGRRVWLMLPFAPDWRWLLDGTDRPWYPTARLFRQPAPRQWEPLVAEIARRRAGYQLPKNKRPRGPFSLPLKLAQLAIDIGLGRILEPSLTSAGSIVSPSGATGRDDRICAGLVQRNPG